MRKSRSHVTSVCISARIMCQLGEQHSRTFDPLVSRPLACNASTFVFSLSHFDDDENGNERMQMKSSRIHNRNSSINGNHLRMRLSGSSLHARSDACVPVCVRVCAPMQTTISARQKSNQQKILIGLILSSAAGVHSLPTAYDTANGSKMQKSEKQIKRCGKAIKTISVRQTI